MLVDDPEPTPAVADGGHIGLASFLDAHVEEIAAAWTQLVRDDPQLQTPDSLTRRQLEDHIPRLLSELARRLRGSDGTAEESERLAAAHGIERWEQGYRLDEVLLELGRIREVVLGFSRRYAGENPGFGDRAQLTAARVIGHYWDEVGANSARQFVQEQAQQVAENARQIEQATHELQAANDELRSLSESRLRLLRIVSHELRNALNSVDLAAQSLLVEEHHDGEYRAAVAVLFRSVRDLHELLDRLLEFSSMLSGAPVLYMQPLDVTEIATDFRDSFQPMAELRGLRFEVRADDAPASITTDPLRLKQIVTNLISNALKYTPRGRITLEFSAADAGHLRIAVADTGMGIAPEDIENIFHEFHRSRRTAAIRGTGLGLPITRHLVTSLGGTMTLQTEVDKGSRFEVILPLVPPSAGSADSPAPQPSGA